MCSSQIFQDSYLKLFGAFVYVELNPLNFNTLSYKVRHYNLVYKAQNTKQFNIFKQHQTFTSLCAHYLNWLFRKLMPIIQENLLIRK